MKLSQLRKFSGGGIGLFIAVASLASCEKPDAVTPAPQSVSATAGATANTAGETSTENRELLATLLAKELGTNSALRQLLRQEAMKMFDGDYDVLYASIAGLEAGGGTVEASLARQYWLHMGGTISQTASTAWVRSVTSGIRHCQFSVPVNCDTWDAGAYTPLVVGLPANFDDSGLPDVKAFDASGTGQVLSGKDEPKNPVVVINSCERLDGNGNVLYPAGAAGVASQRTNNNTDLLEEYQITNISAIEAWVLGGPELYLQSWAQPMPNYSGSGPIQPLQPPYQIVGWRDAKSRNSVKNQQWIRKSDRLYRWDVAQYGPFHRDIWVEEDGGYDITLDINVILPKGIILQFRPRFKNLDDPMGHATIAFNDAHYSTNPRPLPYSTGLIKWHRNSVR